VSTTQHFPFVPGRLTALSVGPLFLAVPNFLPQKFSTGRSNGINFYMDNW